MVRQNSKINAIVSVYKKGAPDNIIFKVQYTKAEGNGAMGNDYNSGYRISEAYAKLAKTIAKTIKKKTKAAKKKISDKYFAPSKIKDSNLYKHQPQPSCE
jgi:acyl-homoserine lactone acylase PvdQ